MGELIYSAIMSVDGYIADAHGEFDWAAPDPEVHGYINDRMRRFGTHLYGRTTYDLMTGWETDPGLAAESAEMRDFARIWQAADKIVYSSTLTEAATARTRVEPVFDPEAVRRLKTASDADLIIGGPTLASHAFAAGLVDECELYLVPTAVGGGLAALPPGQRVNLELLDEHRFGNGTVRVNYRVR